MHSDLCLLTAEEHSGKSGSRCCPLDGANVQWANCFLKLCEVLDLNVRACNQGVILSVDELGAVGARTVPRCAWWVQYKGLTGVLGCAGPRSVCSGSWRTCRSL